MNSPVLFVIVGTSGAGKGVLLRSVRDLGESRVTVIPKATSRERKANDGEELVFYPDGRFPRCYDIVYGNYRGKYGISTGAIWDALAQGKHALLICSNLSNIGKDGRPIRGFVPAIPTLHRVFGPLMKLVYLYSLVTPQDSEHHQREIAAQDVEDIEVRKRKIPTVRKYYVDNIGLFHHVLLNVGDPEDLSDQLFRLVLLYSGRLPV